MDSGFMAVEARAGDDKIVFAYEPPGLRAGVIPTASSAVLLFAYLGAIMLVKKKNKVKSNNNDQI